MEKSFFLSPVQGEHCVFLTLNPRSCTQMPRVVLESINQPFVVSVLLSGPGEFGGWAEGDGGAVAGQHREGQRNKRAL